MPPSKDPAKRARQLGNLRADAAVKHGGFSEQALGPLRDRCAAELSERFAQVATSHEIWLAADRQAQD